eukprot:COSAG01_NODE_2089_length_8454_cov_12.054339_13_plen_229_part_00
MSVDAPAAMASGSPTTTLAELRALKPRQLRERATSLGATAQQVEAAQDEDDVKSALLRINLEFTSTLDVEELRSMKAPKLRERVAAAGVNPAAVEEARDADNQKEELIGLLLEHQAKIDELAAAEAVKRAAEEAAAATAARAAEEKAEAAAAAAAAAVRAAEEKAARAAVEREGKLKAELEKAKAAAQRTESSDQFTLGPVLDGKVREATNQTTHEKVAAKQHTDLAM